MKKLLFLFVALFGLSIPLSVNAIDDPGFDFPCEFIPGKGYINQNNNSHNNDSSYYWITDEDTENLYTSNTYKIGSKYYRALRYDNISMTNDNVFSLQFEIYPNEKLNACPLEDNSCYLWKKGSVKWKANQYYYGYLMLGSTNGHYFDFAGGSNSVVSRVGTLYGDEQYFVKPQDYVSRGQMKSSIYNDIESGLTITMLPFSFKTMGNASNNNIVFTLQDKISSFLNNVYVLGFSLEQTTENGASLENVPNGVEITYEELNNQRDYFRGDRCFVGTLDSDIASPDLEIECNGVIDCTIKEIESGISKFFNSLLDLLNKLFIPDSEKMSNMATDFMDWFDEKLGFLGQPITFTINFLNRFLSLNDTGHYIIKWNDINVPLFDYVIIQGGEVDLASFLNNSTINTIHSVTFVIINGGIGIAFLMLCGKKLDDVFGQTHDTGGESLIEHEGYSFNEKTGEVKETHTISKRRKLTKKEYEERVGKK